ncbi:MAG: hypothetical protein JWM33_286, partial [Caulobacteraceae bacterium]|nr:hypothetical protein [Caulobacteraceae bacterium]
RPAESGPQRVAARSLKSVGANATLVTQALGAFAAAEGRAAGRFAVGAAGRR